MTWWPTKLKRVRPTFHLRKKNASSFHQYPSATSRENYLGSRTVTKLHYRDSASSNDVFSSYAQSLKLIFTTSVLWLDWVWLFLIPYTWKERSHYHWHQLFRPTFTLSQVTKQYGAYTPSPATKTTSAITNVKSDKRLQFQVNRLNIARDTSIKVRPKNSSQNLNSSFLL